MRHRIPWIGWLTSDAFLILWCALGMVGLFYSRALVSIVFGGLVGLGGIHQFAVGSKRTAWLNSLTIPFIGLFALYLLSALISDDVITGLDVVKGNFYWLTIPLGMSLLRPRTSAFWHLLIGVFGCVGFGTTLPLLYDWLANLEEVTASYNIGKTMATPVIHIRYSFLIVLATIGLFHLCHHWPMAWHRHAWVRWRIVLPMLIWMVLFHHVLAVRTGLLALYVTFLGWLWLRGMRAFGMKRALVATLLMIGLLITALNTVPTLENKLAYSRHDLKEFFEGRQNYLFSDHSRLMTIHIGWKGFADHPCLGVGVGDLEAEVHGYYQRMYPAVPVAYQFGPLNEFMHVFMIFGAIGGGLFWLCFFWPLSMKSVRSDDYMLMIYLACIVAFVGDAQLQHQLGKVSVIVLLVLGGMRVQALGGEEGSSTQLGDEVR